MNFNQLHFASPSWFWGTLLIPLVWTLLLYFAPTKRCLRHLEKFIDAHLIQYLLIKSEDRGQRQWKNLLVWSAVWLFLILALAGPRWNFRELELLSKDQSIVILLDLSESMNARDVKPSRLVRAKQKIEDFIHLSKGVKIGLIAFAADPHMITPLTEDKETIRHLLPLLDTDLVHIQGSRLSPALEMASAMLEVEPGANKAVLLVSDGGFEDETSIGLVKKIANKGIAFHVMGVGTHEGAILQDIKGNPVKKNGTPIMSRLVRESLENISNMGNGRYFEGESLEQGEAIILKELETNARAREVAKKKQLWDEGFYLFILPVLPIVLWWYRRGAIVVVLLIFLAPYFDLQAVARQEYFMNSEQLGEFALNDGDYDKAISTFKDPYRKGVAYYKAGNFEAAEKMFRNSSRLDVSSDASYNLGNALARQQKFQEAIEVYESLLKKMPDHKKAKENVEIVKKMLEQQKQEDSQFQNDDTQGKEEEISEKGAEKEGRKTSNSDAKEQQKIDEFPPSDQTLKQISEQNAEKNQGPSTTENNHDNLEQTKEKRDEKQVAAEMNSKNRPKSEEDQELDFWLNRIPDDPKGFFKNKFYLESKKNGTKQGVDPW